MSRSAPPELDALLRRELRALGRLLRWIDDADERAEPIVASLFARAGAAEIIGVTGTPGAGKSTLVDALIASWRASGRTVACVAVDPSSPFSGGAILGDRVRMQRHALDEGVFIRSLATRGALGGISRSTPSVVQVLDAVGFDVVIVETVGVGQDEVEIVRLADCSVVVSTPGQGDEVQAAKAGILEIADLLVVNKADQPGAPRLVRELRSMVELGDEARGPGAWRPPVLETVATSGQGIGALCEGIESFLAAARRSGARAERRRARTDYEVRQRALRLWDQALRRAQGGERWQSIAAALAARRIAPAEAADALAAIASSELTDASR